ncbi:MAG TPA: chorismate-binding protein, partial [Pyrinomonadaceae bacterium]
MKDSPPTPLLLFDFQGPDGEARALCFTNPVRIIIAQDVCEVRPALRAVEREVEAGMYAAGFLSYEAAPAFDAALSVREKASLPLLWFGIFKEPLDQPHVDEAQGFQLSEWHPMTSRERYKSVIAHLREQIARGQTYQVNYTMRLQAQFSGDPLAFYKYLRLVQPAPYNAYL